MKSEKFNETAEPVKENTGSRAGYRGRRGRKGGNTNKDFRGRKPTFGNDFSYWNKDPEYMKSVTNYPWMHVAGTELHLSGPTLNTRVGNIMHVRYLPTIGKSADATSAFNLVIRDTWLAMHRKYRGLGSYQQADLGITILANMNVFALLAYAERLYGIIHSYPIKNRVAPEGLLNAMGLNVGLIQDLQSSAADYRSYLNRIIKKAKRLCLPKGFTALYNWVGLNSFIYSDSKDNLERAGMIVFSPASYFTYQAVNYKDGGCIIAKPLVMSNFTSAAAFLSFIETQIDILLADDDITRICSDLIACFGDNGLEALVEMPEDYAVSIQYDDATLMKLHNSHVHAGETVSTLRPGALVLATGGSEPAVGEYLICQVNNVVISGLGMIPGSGGSATPESINVAGDWYYMESTSARFPVNILPRDLVDTWEVTPSDATRCEALLWKQSSHYQENSGSTKAVIQFDSWATEILVSASVVNVVDAVVSASTSITYVADASTSLGGYCYITQFDWAPIMLRGTYNNSLHGYSIDYVFGDLDNYTIIDTAIILPRVHDAALLSAFNINLNFGSDNN